MIRFTYRHPVLILSLAALGMVAVALAILQAPAVDGDPIVVTLNR